MASINELRAQARRAHQNATKKVSRLKTQGAAISGTELDPRRPIGNIKSYNSRQLNAYIDKLQSFNARGTGFVGSADGLITRGQWQEYKRLETRYRKAGEIYNALAAPLQLPGQDMTVAQRRAMASPDRLTAFGTATNKPYSDVNRLSRNIKGPKALQALIDQMKNKLTPDYVQKHVASQREQHERMLEIIGDQKLIDESRKMSDRQFAIAWNEGGLAEATATRYAVANVEIGRANESIDEDQNDDAYSIIRWAQGINMGDSTPGVALTATELTQIKNVRAGIALNKPVKPSKR